MNGPAHPLEGATAAPASRLVALEAHDAFIAGEVAKLQANIEAEDWDAFETNFTTMVDQANAYHEKYDKSFLRWQLPATSSLDRDVTAT